MAIIPTTTWITPVNEFFSLDQDTTQTFTADDLVNDDTGLNGSVLSMGDILTQPAHGSVVRQASGEYIYTPAQGYIGNDSFNYSVTDQFGNLVTETVQITVLAVKTPPVSAPVITSLMDDAGSAQGAIANGATTDDTQPTLMGTGQPGTTISISDNSIKIGSVVVAADGTWSYTSTTALTSGAHEFSVIASHADGSGATAASTTVSCVIDTGSGNTTPVLDPVITDVMDDMGASQGRVGNGGNTDDTSPLLKGSGEPGTVVNIYDNGIQIGSATVGLDWQWSFTPTTALVAGTHEFTLIGTRTDGSGATNGSTTYTCVIGGGGGNTTPVLDPVITDVMDDMGASQGRVGNGGNTDDTQPLLKGTAEPGTVVDIYDNGVKIGSANVGADWTWSFTPATALTEGTHEFTLIGTRTDGSGATNGSTTYTCVIGGGGGNTTPVLDPVITDVMDDVGAAQGRVGNGGNTDDTQPLLKGTAEPGTVVDIYDNGVKIGSANVGADWTWSFTPAAALATGPHEFTLIGMRTDGSGAKAGSVPYTCVIDTATAPPAPTIVITEDTNGDGIITPAELNNKIDVQVTVPAVAKAGDSITITDQAGNKVTHMLTAAEAAAHTVTLPDAFPVPASGQAITVSVTLTDSVTDLTSMAGTATAGINTALPPTPTIVITEDANNDGSITAAELNGMIDVQVMVSATAKAGDLITVTDQAGNKVTHTMTAAEAAAHTITLPDAFPAPASGQLFTVTATLTDSATNLTSMACQDSAVINTALPAAPTVVISEDANNDGVITLAELSNKIDVQIALPSTAKVGDSLVVTDQAGNTVTHALTAADVASHTLALTDAFPVPANGQVITVSATLTDSVTGLTSPANTDSATMNTTPVVNPVMTPIITNAIDDVGPSQGNVASGGSTDDSLPLLQGTGEPGTKVDVYDNGIKIGSADVGANWLWSFTPATALPTGLHSFTVVGMRPDGSGPTNGASPYPLTVVPQATAPATPTVVISEDTNNDGTITSAELSNKVDVQVTVSDTAKTGDVVTVTDQAGNKVTHALTAAEAVSHTVSLPDAFPAPANGQVITVSATLTDSTSSLTSTSGTDSATMNTPVITPVMTPIITNAIDDVGPSQGNVASGGSTDDSLPLLQGTGEPGTKVDVYDNGVKIGSANVGTNWLWSFTPTTALPVGVHTFTVVGMRQDGSGSTNGASPYPLTVVPMATPPAAPTIVISEDTNNDGVITLAELNSKVDVQLVLPGSAKVGDTLTVTDQAGNKVTHALTAAEVASNSVSLPDAFPAPANGQVITVSATLTDSATGLTSVANTDSATMNTTPVVNPVLPPVITNAVDDVGASQGNVASGGSTDDSLPLLQGTGEPGTKVDVYDNGIKIGSANVGTNWLWSFTPTTALPVGAHTFTVVGMRPDGSGPTNGAAPYPITVVQEATPPAAPTVVISEDTNNDGVITLAELNGKIDVQIALPSTAKVGDSLVVTDQAGNKATHALTAADVASHTIALTDAFPVPANGQVITVSATLTDSATGLTSVANTDSATMNTTPVVNPVLPPVITNAVDDVGPSQGNVASGGSTDDSLPLLQGTGEPGTKVDVYDNGIKIGSANVGTNWLWSFTPTTALPAGPHTFTVVGMRPDGSGPTNGAAPYPITVVQPATPPAAPTVVISEDANNDGVITSAELNSKVDVQVTVSATAKTGDVVTVTDQAGNKVTHALTAAEALSHTVSLPDAFPAPANGQVITVSATLTDSTSGLTSTSGTDSATMNTAPVVVPVLTPVITTAVDDVGPVQGQVAKGGTTDDTQPALQGTGEPGTVVDIYDNGVKIGTAPVGTNWLWTFTPATPLGNGPHNFTVVGTRPDGTGATNGAAPYPLTVAQAATPPAAPTVVISEDANNDGSITSAELNNRIDVQVTVSATAKTGDVVTVTDQAGNKVTHALTAAEALSHTVSLPDAFPAPANGQVITVSATLTDSTTGLTSTSNTDSATMNTAPAVGAPTVVIATDANNDGTINTAEFANRVDVQVTLPAGVKAGDQLTVTDNAGNVAGRVLTAADITAGTVTLASAFPTPTDAQTLTVQAKIINAAGASSPSGTDSAIVDLTAPSAPGVIITTDDDNSGQISKAELTAHNNVIDVKVPLPADARTGDTLKVTDQAGHVVTKVLTATDITIRAVTLPGAFPAPADGQTVKVTAVVSDPAGNASPTATDTALMHTTAPAIEVSIVNDKDNNGTLTRTELAGATRADVRVDLPNAAQAGDRIDVTDQSGVSVSKVLTAADIAAHAVSFPSAFALPAVGGTITVTAKITDTAGNVSPLATDKAVFDGNYPPVAIDDTGTVQGYATPVVAILAMGQDSGNAGPMGAPWSTSDADAGRPVYGQVSSLLTQGMKVQLSSSDRPGTWIDAVVSSDGLHWTAVDSGSHFTSWSYTSRIVDTSGNVVSTSAPQVVALEGSTGLTGPATYATQAALDAAISAGIDGGAGITTLKLSGSGMLLNLPNASSVPGQDILVNNYERFDLGANGRNTLVMSVNDVLNAGSTNAFVANGKTQVMVAGDVTDTLNLTHLVSNGGDTGNWALTGTKVISGVTYNVFDHSTLGAEVLVQQGVNVSTPAIGGSPAATTLFPIATGNVLPNDTDPDGPVSALQVSGVSNSATTVQPGTGVNTVIEGRYGHLTLTADGNYSYVADKSAGLVNAADDVFYYLNKDGGNANALAPAKLTIHVTPPYAQVVNVSSPTAAEGETLDFTVTTTGSPVVTPITLAFNNGTATVGTDTGQPVQVNFGNGWTNLVGNTVNAPAGTTSFQVRVPTVDDKLIEPRETMTLSAQTAASSASGTGSIVDDDLQGLNLQVVGTEDTPLVLKWSDFNLDNLPNAAGNMKITSLPTDGVLQYNNGTAWTPVTVNQTVTKADIDGGKLRFLPDANESGIDGYNAPGVGNMKNDYAKAGFSATDTAGNQFNGNLTIDIKPVADSTQTVTMNLRHHFDAGPAPLIGGESYWDSFTFSLTGNNSPDVDGSERLMVGLKNLINTGGLRERLFLADGTQVQPDANGVYWVKATDTVFISSGAGCNTSADYALYRQEVNGAMTVLDQSVSALKHFSYTSPLVLDLNGDGVQTLSEDNGVNFDLTGQGHVQHTGWVSAQDGLLALDLNGNGQIDTGAELFGQGTALADGTTAQDGFQALAALDSNHDAKITSEDALFAKLQVWIDANSDGVTQAGELQTLGQLGIASLGLDNAASTEVNNGNVIGLTGNYTTADGVNHAMADVWFGNSTAVTAGLDASGHSLDTLLANAGLAAAAPAAAAPAAKADVETEQHGNHHVVHNAQASLHASSHHDWAH